MIRPTTRNPEDRRVSLALFTAAVLCAIVFWLAGGLAARAQSNSPIVSGVATVALTPSCLGAVSLRAGPVLKAGYNNSGIVYIGSGTINYTTWYPLKPGEAVSYAVSSLSMVCYWGSNAGDILYYTGN